MLLYFVLVVLVSEDAPGLLWLVWQEVAALDVIVAHHHHEPQKSVVHEPPELLDVVEQAENQGVSFLLFAEPGVETFVVFDILFEGVEVPSELVLLFTA